MTGQTCRGCDWYQPVLAELSRGWCRLHETRVGTDDPACDYRRELKEDIEEDRE